MNGKDPFDYDKVKPRGKFVFYLREGTKTDIDDQRNQIITAFDPKLKPSQIIKEYIEPRSSNPYEMPKLELAIKYAVRKKANVIAAKLGSRINNLKFVALMLEAYTSMAYDLPRLMSEVRIGWTYNSWVSSWPYIVKRFQ